MIHTRDTSPIVCIPTKELLTLLSYCYALFLFALMHSWVLIVHKRLDHGGMLKQCLHYTSVSVDTAHMCLLSQPETDHRSGAAQHWVSYNMYMHIAWL